MDLTIIALVNELAPNKDLFDVLCGNQTTKQFTITLNECSNNGLDPARAKIAYNFRGAILTSENHTQDIGGNETVDLTYSIQIGGSNDNTNGLFMSGSYATGSNPALSNSYPNGLSGLLQDFYKIGSDRNY